MSQKDQKQALFEHFFRHEHARMVAVLTRYFGLPSLEIAEDIVQGALLEALEQWSVHELPANPSGWLMDVAKKRMINFLKRNRTFQERVLPNFFAGQKQEVPQMLDFQEELIEDSLLRMIFCCCHPALALESQIALALKSLCGFSVPEVAQALLTNEATINKRLYRAREKFRSGSIVFELPENANLHERLDAVLLTIYLLFNAGYYSRHPDAVIRKELCEEAIRLADFVAGQFPDYLPIKALQALQWLQYARLDSRVNALGEIITLEEQNRAHWDKSLISKGIQYLEDSMGGETLSRYHLEAGIIAEHCIASGIAETNWGSIAQQYAILETLIDSPVIRLNHAIAVFYLGKKQEAIAMLEALQSASQLDNYLLLHATLGECYLRTDQPESARASFTLALALALTDAEKNILQQKLTTC